MINCNQISFHQTLLCVSLFLISNNKQANILKKSKNKHMDIGRKLLSDTDFANLWAILYQELYSLSTSKSCDAAMVYNTIYIICTSNSSFEDKLYWKIGDFLYNRCKCHKNEILGAKDYLKEYIQQFLEYDSFVTSINKLGCFLNESVKGRKLDDFGYLLWERVVIQNLRKSFFEEVYDYNYDEKIKIVQSFKKIIPDATQKMLYYNEKYEKIAIEKIKLRYNTTKITNFVEFCSYIYEIINLEKKYLKSRFLEESYEKVIYAMEQSLFGSKYYELIFNIAELIKVLNQERINCLLTANQEKNEESQDFHVLQNNFKQMEFNYESIPFDKQEKLKNFIDNEFYTNKALNQIFFLINKELEETANDYSQKSHDGFSNLILQLGCTNTGFIILKKSYALYIDSIIKSNPYLLNNKIETIYSLLEAFDIFPSIQFKQIRDFIMKYYLQRTESCFLKRTCNYTSKISGTSFQKLSKNLNTERMITSDQISNLRPYSTNFSLEYLYYIKIFQNMMDLVPDKKEFLNLYQILL